MLCKRCDYDTLLNVIYKREFIGIAMQADLNAYLVSWAEELKARSNRVRQLIGDAHWLSDGHHKEIIIREFLSRYLASRFVVSRAFIRPSSIREKCSPEIDILISDPLVHSPFFAEGDLRIIPPSSALATIEVKSSFSRQNLDNAMINIAETKRCLRFNSTFDKIWNCICFFTIDESRSVLSVLETVRDSIISVEKDQRERNYEADFLHLLPSCIATLSKYLIFIKPLDNGRVVLRCFELSGYSLPCAFIDLFAVLRAGCGGPVLAEFDDIIEMMDIPEPTHLEFAFEDKNGKAS